MELNLSGQAVVVVGGSRGLGFAIASAFAEEGSLISLIDRDPDVAKSAATLPGEVEAIVADVTDFAAIQAAEVRIRSRFGRVDHLVFAAAIGSGKFGFPFWNLEPGDWDRVLRVNVVGAANVAHAFAPGMAVSGSGSILFLASVAGQIGSQTDPPYSASKAALINFAQCAAKDLAPHGVRVNTLNPGMVRTALNQSVYEAWASSQPEADRLDYEQWAANKIQKVVPLNRWQEPEDIAAMAVFLASQRAQNITGQSINVDGGFVMHW